MDNKKMKMTTSDEFSVGRMHFKLIVDEDRLKDGRLHELFISFLKSDKCIDEVTEIDFDKSQMNFILFSIPLKSESSNVELCIRNLETAIANSLKKAIKTYNEATSFEKNIIDDYNLGN